MVPLWNPGERSTPNEAMVPPWNPGERGAPNEAMVPPRNPGERGAPDEAMAPPEIPGDEASPMNEMSEGVGQPPERVGSLRTKKRHRPMGMGASRDRVQQSTQ